MQSSRLWGELNFSLTDMSSFHFIVTKGKDINTMSNKKNLLILKWLLFFFFFPAA